MRPIPDHYNAAGQTSRVFRLLWLPLALIIFAVTAYSGEFGHASSWEAKTPATDIQFPLVGDLENSFDDVPVRGVDWTIDALVYQPSVPFGSRFVSTRPQLIFTARAPPFSA